jgi:hypothetical protein
MKVAKHLEYNTSEAFCHYGMKQFETFFESIYVASNEVSPGAKYLCIYMNAPSGAHTAAPSFFLLCRSHSIII